MLETTQAKLMNLPSRQSAQTMKCSTKGCPGEYEERKIVHTVKNSERIIVIDHVPADVCTICGDTLLSPNTVKHIQRILEEAKSPEKTIPL